MQPYSYAKETTLHVKMNIYLLKSSQFAKVALLLLVLLATLVGLRTVFPSSSSWVSSRRSLSLATLFSRTQDPVKTTEKKGNSGSDSKSAQLAKKVATSLGKKPNTTSLTYSNEEFRLGGKTVRFFSGSIHYFRVVPEYWKQRLQLMKAAHLNTIETIVPWNLHEEAPGKFNFEGILDLRKFIQTAQELDLYVLLRPGPYVNSECDLGGLPSWLLQDSTVRVRWMHKPFLDAVDRYYKELFEQISDLQYTNGGPIVAMQLEHDFGTIVKRQSPSYMQEVQKIMWKHGLKEMLYTTSSKYGMAFGGVPDVLMAVNFKEKDSGSELIADLRKQQPSAPILVMEFWSGWFDHWGDKHHIWNSNEFEAALKFILDQGASVNFYMFIGGTNFGFMNGANLEKNGYAAVVTSYDYDAPVSESGQLTAKYEIVQRLLKPYTSSDDKALNPVTPATPKDYGIIEIKGRLFFEDLVSLIQPVKSENIVSMENLSLASKLGQSFGFVNYRKRIKFGSRLKIHGLVRDRAQVILNGVTLRDDVSFRAYETDIDLSKDASEDNNLDLFVENMGRVSFGGPIILTTQTKGLQTPVSLDDVELPDWLIYPFEFKRKFLEKAKGLKWHSHWEPGDSKAPGLFSAILDIADEPQDTFLDMQGWTKGVVFVNYFNIGRYWIIGPQQTLYVPAPLLRKGQNEILVFELHKPAKILKFSARPLLG